MLRERYEAIVSEQGTGATRSEVEQFLDRIVHEGSRLGEQLTETAQQYADAAKRYAAESGEYLRDQYQLVYDQAGDYSAKIAETVRRRPGQSLAIAFGLGIAAGALMLFSRKR